MLSYWYVHPGSEQEEEARFFFAWTIRSLASAPISLYRQSAFMKQIKLSGRERTVLRAIDFSTGTLGEELLERTKLEPEDLVDVLNGLMTVGYAEMRPYGETTSMETVGQTTFDVNPSYAIQLREALVR